MVANFMEPDMTVTELRKELNKLIKAGYGAHKIGWFDHQRGDFIESDEPRLTKNGGYYEPPNRPKKTEEVIQITAKYNG